MQSSGQLLAAFTRSKGKQIEAQRLSLKEIKRGKKRTRFRPKIEVGLILGLVRRNQTLSLIEKDGGDDGARTRDLCRDRTKSNRNQLILKRTDGSESAQKHLK